MVQQSKVGITRSAVDGALVLEYEDMSTGKPFKLSRSQCLCPGQIEIPKARLFPSVLAPQIRLIGDFEGEHVMSTSGPSIGFLSNQYQRPCCGRTDQFAYRLATMACQQSKLMDFRPEGISVNDLKHVGSRTFFLESAEVLMYILTISERTLQSESNRFCSHKARSRVDNDRHLRHVLVLARTFRRRTSTTSPRSCSIKRTVDFSSEYMTSLVSSCCTDPACSELWIERISGSSRDVRGEELQVVCVCGAPAIDLDPRMSIRGLHAAKR